VASKRKILTRLMPATRTVRRLREMGYVADMAELSMGLVRKDWGNFADLIAIRPDEFCCPEVLLVQATGYGEIRKRERKVLMSPDAYDCVRAGCRVQVWGWDRRHEAPKIIDLSDLGRYEPLPDGHPDRI